MKLASHLTKVLDAYGLEKTIDILEKAGFEAIDFSLDEPNNFFIPTSMTKRFFGVFENT